jgi:hypothetical protein
MQIMCHSLQSLMDVTRMRFVHMPLGHTKAPGVLLVLLPLLAMSMPPGQYHPWGHGVGTRRGSVEPGDEVLRSIQK